MRVMDEAEKGKARIAESVGKGLDATPEVKGYVIASKKGEVIAASGVDDAEKLAAAAVLLAWKGQELSSRMGLGETGFSTLLSEKGLTVFMDCGGLVASIVTKKSVVSETLRAVVDNVRKRLKYHELTHAQQGSEMFQ